VQYTPDEWNDLAGYLRPHAEDSDSSLAAWTKSFVAGDQDRTTDVLHRMLTTFATISNTVQGKHKEPSRPVKPFGRNRAPAGTMPG